MFIPRTREPPGVPPRTPLLSPETYFDRHPNPVLPGLGVFAAYALGTVVGLYAAVSLLLGRIENAPPALERAMNDVLGTLAVLTLVIAVIALLVVAAVMHYLVGGSGTDGTYGDAVAVAGWAYAPDAISVPINYLLLRRDLSRQSFDGSDPEVLQAQLEAMQDPSGVGSLVVVVFAVGWSVYILAGGTAGTHDVDLGTAVGPALLVGIGSLLLNVVF